MSDENKTNINCEEWLNEKLPKSVRNEAEKITFIYLHEKRVMKKHKLKRRQE